MIRKEKIEKKEFYIYNIYIENKAKKFISICL